MEEVIDRKLVVYDIETIINFFSYCDLNIDTLEEKVFIISEDTNNIVELVEYLYSLKGMISYNGNSFDYPILHYIIKNYKSWNKLSNLEIITLIYQKAQWIIESQREDADKKVYVSIRDKDVLIPQLDLMKIWHFDNLAKRCSLKWIQYMIDYHNIEEMPIPHNIPIKNIDIPNIISYNKNDVWSTFELYKITIGDTNIELYKGIDKIKLRRDIIQEFNIPCFNYNDVKIGDEINKLGYCKLTGITKQDLRFPNKKKEVFKFEDCFPSYYTFKTDAFNNFIKTFKNIEIKDEKQHFKFTYNGTTYTIAKGGLHSNDPKRIVKPNKNEILRDADIGSQYPNAIRKRKLFPRHLGEEWLVSYTNIIERRLEAKKQFKLTRDGKYKAYDEAYKLALNGGGFGKTGESTSWQYDPFISMSVTIGNQIEILMLIESLEIEGIHIISANTDGIVCLFDKSMEDIYYRICKEWEVLVGNDVLGQLEYVDYKLLVQTSVNDYIAIKLDGEVKKKGDFMTEFELHKNKSARIIPLTLEAYYTQAIKPEEFIKNHTNIFDFCLGVKSIGKNRLIHLNVNTQSELKLQKINRFYISNNGWNLLKRLPPLENKRPTKQLDIFGDVDDGTREQEVEAGWLSTIYNKHEIKDINEYNIDYSYYIQKVQEIVNKIK